MSNTIAETLAGERYNRARLRPIPGEPDYLHLRDLRDALAPFATNDPIRILDFGCGGSPYRTLFPNADYRRETDVASPTAAQDLQRLRRDGWLDQEGGGRSVRYVAGRKLQERWSFSQDH